MRWILSFALLSVGMWLFSSGSTAQTLKNTKDGGDTKKANAKAKEKEKEKKVEWPKEIQGKKLEVWVKEMKESRDASERELAINTLSGFGPDARKVYNRNLLYSVINETDIGVKLTAIQVSSVVGFEDIESADAAMDVMVGMLKNPAYDRRTKQDVLTSLSNCGPLAKRVSAIPIIKEYISKDTRSWHLRKAAAFSLGRIGQPMPKPTSDKDGKEGKPLPPPKKKDSKKDLSGEGPDILAVTTLMLMVDKDKESSHEVRREAMGSLLMLGPPHDEATWRALRTEMLRIIKFETDRQVVSGAHLVSIQSEMEKIKPNNPHLTALGDQLDSNDPELKLEALQALGSLGDYAKPYFGKIRKLAEGVDPQVKDLSKISAEDLKKLTKEELKTYTEDLKKLSTDVTLAVSAIWVLAMIESQQGDVIEILGKLKSHKIEAIKSAADNADKYVKLPKNDPDAKNIKKDQK